MKRWFVGCGLLLGVVSAVIAAEPLDQVVALVNDGVITSSELDKQVEVLRQQLAAKQVALPPEDVLRKQVLQHLIDVDLQLQIAKLQGVQIDNAELDDIIDKIAERNHLTHEQLKEALVKQGMTWTQYRENLQKEVLMSRLQQKAVGSEVTVSKDQIESYLKQTQRERLANQQLYHVQNIVIALPEAPTTEQLTQANEKAHLLLEKIGQGADFSQLAVAESSGEMALEGGDLGERHLAELPEVFAKIVMEMKVGEVKGPIRTGNGFQLLKLVGVTGGSQQHRVTQTHVRHILIKPSASTTAEEAEAQLSHLYQQLRSGGDFARLAKQYSLDPVSAMKGGDLGWVTSGDLVPEFEKAMETLALHVVSEAIKTRYGWHFIEVLERKTVDDTATFEREQVHQFLQQRKFTEAVQRWQQRLRSEAYIQIVDKSLA
ncbi:MAG: peptidylprolyl isomerase [Gammaproteobacteria bacterium]|nr:peptidylprolyl isomerase [Gammaproteobacteria bacterium]